MYIDGKWVDSESDRTFSVKSPVTGETLASFPQGTKEDLKAAVDAALDAQEKIAEMPIRERERLAFRISGEIEKGVKSFARDLVLEHGKPLQEAMTEVADVGPNILWQAEDLKRLDAPALEGYSTPDSWYISRWEPLGTVGVITPWTLPWLLPGGFVVQAMLAGNSVVWKPASNTPISAAHLMECVDRAGVPPGVINLVSGNGEEVGRSLVEHPKVDGIGFAGESATGEEVTRRAGLKKLTLELGGLGPLIVMDDANPKKAAEDIAHGCYTNTGHSCIHNERIFVHEEIRNSVLNYLVEEAKGLLLGNPLDEGTTIGPINNEGIAARMVENIEDAVAKGGRLLYGGQKAGGFPTDLYYEPSIVDGVTEDMLFNQRETLAPVAPIFSFTDLEEAIETANKPRYGLSMAIHTNDLKVALEAARKLKAGQVAINEPVYSWDYHHPWGGFRRSGVGRMGGRWSLTAFMEIKTVIMNMRRTG